MVSGTAAPGTGPPTAAVVPPAAITPAGDPHASRPERLPLVLLAYACGFAMVALAHGLDETLGVIAGVLNVDFGIYF